MNMKLTVEGSLNLSYAQTLCLIFFPGSKFAQMQEENPNAPHVRICTQARSEGVYARAEITADGKFSSYECTEPYREQYPFIRTEKIAAGRAMLKAGESLLGYTPPWGIMTGVRPAKLAQQLHSAGLRSEEVRRTLTKEYFVNPKKAMLLTKVARNERRVMKKLGKQPTCSVYISIPFCPSRCAYCSFVAYSTKRLLSLIPAYLERLKRDIVSTFSTIRDLGLKVATIYIGGGTPTILSSDQIGDLLACIGTCVDPASLLEYTMEAGRPDTITPEKLHAALAGGVNRISINPQTLNDNILKNIGRNHTTEDFYRAFHIARECGIQYINTDLIAGLPGDSFPGFSKSMDEIIRLAPENITVHTFSVKKSADILKSDSMIYSRTGGDTAKSVDYSQLQTALAEYLPYYIYRQKNTVGNLENVGFAKKGAEGLYNIFMMEEVHSIFACGAGAVTKLVAPGETHIERIFMPKYPYEYLDLPQDDSVRQQILDFYAENWGIYEKNGDASSHR